MAPSDLRDQLQTTLGDAYLIERELPPGGMSRLFLANERSLDRLVVIKLLPPEYASEVSAARFQREVTFTAHLQHPHILPILSAGSRDGLVYYVMPYVEGESLRQRLDREGKLPVSAAVQILREVADALARAHEAGVVHRDIKPENILLQRDHALLADFGVARALHEATGSERLTDTGMGLGTPSYMAPEQLAGDRNVDTRADVYALAVVGYEMLAGVAPFTGPTPQAVAAAHFTSAPKPLAELLPEVPLVVSGAIAKALAKEPGDRFATAAAFRDALSGGTAQAPKPRRRGRYVVTVALLALIATGALLRVKGGITPRPLVGLPRVIVAPLVNRSGDSTLDPLGNMAADWIAQGLGRSGLVDVVDSRIASPAVAQAHQIESPATVQHRLDALASKTGARIVISGSYYRDGDSLRFQGQLADAATGRLMQPIPPVAGPIARPTAGLETLRSVTTGALAAVIDPRLTASATTPTTPPTYEAYREYMEGMDADLVRRDDQEAVEHYRHVVALDSTFFLAPLNAYQDFTRMKQWARADSVVHTLDRKREQMGPYERAYLDVELREIRGDYNGALRMARAFVQRYPASQDALWEWEESAAEANRLQEAVSVWSRVDLDGGQFAGSPSGYNSYAYDLHLVGDYAAELRVQTVSHQKYPQELSELVFLDRAFAAFGRGPEVRAILDSIKLFAGSPRATANWLRYLGRELHIHGLGAASADAFAQALALYSDSPAEPGWDRRRDMAPTLSEAGHWDEAYPLAKQLATDYPDSEDFMGLFGVVAARLNRRAEATMASARLAEITRPYSFGWPTFWRARIAAAIGDRDTAVRLLRQAFAEGSQCWRAHNILEFDGLRDYKPYQDLVRPRG